MFVTKGRYEAMCRERDMVIHTHNALLAKYNQLVQRINNLGGETFLQNARIPKAQHDTRLTPDDINRMIRLCHPDRHGGSAASKEATQKLLAIRG